MAASTYQVTRLLVAGREVYTAGPEAHGNHRLRTLLIEPGAAGDVEREAWSWLPAPESVAAGWYVSANGILVRAERDGASILFIVDPL